MKLSRRKMQKLRRKFEVSPVFDLTGMLDVVFILLVFFVLTANVAQNVFDLELPSADENFAPETPVKKGEEIKITLFTNGQFAIGAEKFTSFGPFKEALLMNAKKNPENSFLIISESSLQVQTLFELLTFLKSHNITKIDILLKKQ